jgi:hypothetical protein
MALPEREFQEESMFPEPDPEVFETIDSMFHAPQVKENLLEEFLMPRGSNKESLLAAHRVRATGNDGLEYTFVNGFREEARQVERCRKVVRTTPVGSRIFLVWEVALVSSQGYEYRRTGSPGWRGRNECYQGTKEQPSEKAKQRISQLADNFLGRPV